MFFLVKAQIDLEKLPELGKKLQTGELDTNNIKSTYCLKDEPTVGISIWEAKNNKDFEEKFKPHKKYYKEVKEILHVITPEQAMGLLMGL